MVPTYQWSKNCVSPLHGTRSVMPWAVRWSGAVEDGQRNTDSQLAHPITDAAKHGHPQKLIANRLFLVLVHLDVVADLVVTFHFLEQPLLAAAHPRRKLLPFVGRNEPRTLEKSIILQQGFAEPPKPYRTVHASSVSSAFGDF